MPEPAGLSIVCPTTGQFVTGIVRLLVARTLKLAPVALVKPKWNNPPTDITAEPNCGGVTASVVRDLSEPAAVLAAEEALI